MEIKKRNRAELKSYFVKNAIPTESNFADLIDAALIQKSDGVAKLPGDPLSIEAVGDDNSRKQALSLYRSFTDNKPSWNLELSPRTAPSDPATARVGLGVTDGNGVCRLFIDAATGNIGIGTTAPAAIFHVRAASGVGVLESTTNEAFLKLQTVEGVENRVELANRAGGRLALWTRAGGDSLNILRDGRVGIRTDTPARVLHIGAGGQIALAQANGVSTDSTAGLFWNTDEHYAIRRSGGTWTAPDYQQLVLDWPTGIVLTPGTGANAGSGKSYVDIRGGKGLRVSDGSVVVGPGDPGDTKLKVASSATDHVSTIFGVAGSGELRMVGWSSGWNINAQTDGKHLYINRDSGASTNLYLGRNGAELQVLANGNVGVGGVPGTRLHVYGDSLVTGSVRAEGGLVFDGNLAAHLNTDGALYRYDGQCYLAVDDNLYIRDTNSKLIKFHFDTIAGIIRQDDWSGVSFQSNWVNYQSGYNNAGYYKDRQGRVHLRGLVRNGVVGEAQTIFTLPAGYRPAGRELHNATSNDGLGRVDILTDGRVIPYFGNPAWLCLDGISFRAA